MAKPADLKLALSRKDKVIATHVSRRRPFVAALTRVWVGRRNGTNCRVRCCETGELVPRQIPSDYQNGGQSMFARDITTIPEGWELTKK